MTPLDVRGVLETRRRELGDRLGRIQRDRMHLAEPLAARFSEQAVQRENDEVLDRLEVATREDLKQVLHALRRFEMRQYGVCEVCGFWIEALRQQALPAATKCQSCADRAVAVA